MHSLSPHFPFVCSCICILCVPESCILCVSVFMFCVSLFQHSARFVCPYICVPCVPRVCVLHVLCPCICILYVPCIFVWCVPTCCILCISASPFSVSHLHLRSACPPVVMLCISLAFVFSVFPHFVFFVSLVFAYLCIPCVVVFAFYTSVMFMCILYILAFVCFVSPSSVFCVSPRVCSVPEFTPFVSLVAALSVSFYPHICVLYIPAFAACSPKITRKSPLWLHVSSPPPRDVLQAHAFAIHPSKARQDTKK